MKMEALTTFMKDQPDVKKVYLINQNYAHGQQVVALLQGNHGPQAPRRARSSAKTCTRWPGARTSRPTSPRSRPSGADTVVTGNWGQDLTLLVKAANDAGLNANFYTYYAVTSGTPTAMGAGVGGKVRVVAYRPQRRCRATRRSGRTTSRSKFNDDFYTLQTYNAHVDAERRAWPRPRAPTRSRWPRRWRA